MESPGWTEQKARERIITDFDEEIRMSLNADLPASTGRFTPFREFRI
jgi:hypothetical protein